MGRSGNPAWRAAERDPVTQQTGRVLRDLVDLVKVLQDTGLHPQVLVHAQAAGAGLLAVHAHQTQQPPPWDRMKEIA